jgi:hypothetical protein
MKSFVFVAPLLFAGLLGCARGFSLAELPPEPIAFIYRTTDEAKRRAEILNPKSKPTSRTSSLGPVVRMKTVMDYISGTDDSRQMVDTLGRMAFVDPRAGEVIRLPFARPGTRPLQWSGDHQRLVYRAMVEGRPQVFEYDVASEQAKRLTSGRWPHGFASVGPDDVVVFSRTTGSGPDLSSRIWLLDAKGETRPLTTGPRDWRPVFSPEGDAVLYNTLMASGTEAIARTELDGQPSRIIARGSDPVFSPDGATVVYSGPWKGAREIWRMNPDGSGKYVLGGRADALQRWDHITPAISPDGQYVVYVEEELGRERLRIRRLDGSGDRLLLEGGGAANPVW